MGEGREKGERENGGEIEQEGERGYERQDMKNTETDSEREAETKKSPPPGSVVK